MAVQRDSRAPASPGDLRRDACTGRRGRRHQQEIIDYVFPQACAAFLGVDMPTVAVGEAVFPVLHQRA